MSLFSSLRISSINFRRPLYYNLYECSAGSRWGDSLGVTGFRRKERGFMKTQRVVIALVVVNLVCLAFQFARSGPKQIDGVAPIVRAGGLELVDEQGRVRAELKVFPAQPDLKMPDGTVGYPETVMLRLITSKGGPNVKLVTTEDGAGLVIGGESGYVQILSRGKEAPFVKIVTKDGNEKVMRP